MQGEVHCDHCHMPADICLCGVDRELVWRDDYPEGASNSHGWSVALGLLAWVALCAIVYGATAATPTDPVSTKLNVCFAEGVSWPARSAGMCWEADRPR